MGTSDISEKEPRQLDEVETAILKYIIQNPGLTENKIAKTMRAEGICWRETTRKKIRNLIALGFVDDRKQPNGFHKLYASDKSQFNSIIRELSEIKKIIDLMHESHKMLKSKLGQPYIDTISAMLRYLVVLTPRLMMPDYDTQVLYAFISKLMLKLNLRAYNLPGTIKLLRDKRDELNRIREELPAEPWAKDNVTNFRLVDDIITKSKKFENMIMEEIAEWRERSNAI